jgi:hypothetical protein
MGLKGEHYPVTIFVLMLMAACATALEAPHTIELPPAGQTIQIAGQLQGMDQVEVFHFFARTGTILKIDISGKGAIRGIVESPSGQTEGGPGGMILNQELTETGIYRLRVKESTMGEAWQGEFTVRIETLR